MLVNYPLQYDIIYEYSTNLIYVVCVNMFTFSVNHKRMTLITTISKVIIHISNLKPPFIIGASDFAGLATTCKCS